MAPHETGTGGSVSCPFAFPKAYNRVVEVSKVTKVTRYQRLEKSVGGRDS